MILYAVINRYGVSRGGRTLFLPGEEHLPLVPEAAIVYAIGFVLPVLLVSVRPSGLRVVRVLVAFATTVVVAFALFLLLPVCFERSAVTGRHSEWLRLARLDDSCNCFPSLHVAICCLVYLACRKSVRRPGLLLATVIAVSVSTVLVKQHYVVDVASGTLLAIAGWRVSEIFFGRFTRPGFDGLRMRR